MEKPNSKHAGRWKLLLVLAVCAAPMLLSYLFYFVIKPEGRTNYGVILDPRSYPMPKLDAHLLGGESKELDAYKGKWILLQADSGECADACKKKMYDMRQLRLIQGKEMDRIERVWLITDNKPVDTVLIREYDGTRMLSVSQDKLKSWLPVDANTVISDHIYIIDPLGNLMMRFPKDADPNKVKKDIGKLLKASAIG
ncbi:SCO family protein [Undibacterium sp. Rencai35W]|uniref:SCO family protein n=1 Tax=Undibacterium sp. Rencai35W TaxID=3413046 RepID=UPI003BF3B2CB